MSRSLIAVVSALVDAGASLGKPDLAVLRGAEDPELVEHLDLLHGLASDEQATATCAEQADATIWNITPHGMSVLELLETRRNPRSIFELPVDS